MKIIKYSKNVSALLVIFLLLSCNQQNTKQEFITTDIDNFWNAYDEIVKVTDTSKQKQLIKELYIDKATTGLELFMEARNYTADAYVKQINSYPKFWESIRNNTLNTEKHYDAINMDINKLKTLYPELKHSPIYFSIGNFRSNGTIKDGNVLIGCEQALLSKDIDVSELPEYVQEFHELNNPIKDLPFLCTHEYVHTQQKKMEYYLLNNIVYEGIAEFVAVTATGKKSYLSGIQFAEDNYEEVRNRFEEDMFKTYWTNWIWSAGKIMGERDLGYGVGFGIAKRIYDKADDKKQAIKEMLALEFTDKEAVIAYIDKSGYFSKPYKELLKEYESIRPKVSHISGIQNGSKNIKSGLTELTVHFSEILDGRNAGLDYGDKGEETLPKIVGNRVWSDDNKSWTISLELEPSKHYQLLITDGFATEKGVQLKPYLVEFWTL